MKQAPMQTTKFYIRTQAVGAVIFNVILNPLLAWLANLSRMPTPITTVAISMIVTCLILCTAIAYFVGRNTQRALTAGELKPDGPIPHRVLGHFPSGWLPLGLLLGICSAVVLVPLLSGLLAIFADELPFWGMLLFTTIWPSSLAYLIATLVIRRQLMEPQ